MDQEERQKLTKRAYLKGVLTQTYAMGKDRDTIAARVKSASRIADSSFEKQANLKAAILGTA